MIEVRKSCSYWRNGWQWSCPVCHYGNNIPWTDVDSFAECIAEVDLHLAQHREAGQRLEWAPIRLPMREEP